MVGNITLEEAIQDYLDNEQDIQMCTLAVKNGWTRLDDPAGVLLQMTILRPNIITTIVDLGGQVPLTEDQRLREEVSILRDTVVDLQMLIIEHNDPALQRRLQEILCRRMDSLPRENR